MKVIEISCGGVLKGTLLDIQEKRNGMVKNKNVGRRGHRAVSVFK